MPIRENHPVFPSIEGLTKLWRYMDFAKYMDLLTSRQLHFSASSRLGDPMEGLWTDVCPSVFTDQLSVQIAPTLALAAVDLMSANAEKMRNHIYINCWTANEHDCYLMWKSYARTDESVCIQTTMNRFSRAVQASSLDIYIAPVNYIDYQIDHFPSGNCFIPYLYKQKYYREEHEIRAMIFDGKNYQLSTLGVDGNPPAGLRVDVELNDLIESVFINPNAPSWFSELVKSVLKKYGIPAIVEQSGLARRPKSSVS